MVVMIGWMRMSSFGSGRCRTAVKARTRCVAGTVLAVDSAILTRRRSFAIPPIPCTRVLQPPPTHTHPTHTPRPAWGRLLLKGCRLRWCCELRCVRRWGVFRSTLQCVAGGRTVVHAPPDQRHGPAVVPGTLSGGQPRRSGVCGPAPALHVQLEGCPERYGTFRLNIPPF